MVKSRRAGMSCPFLGSGCTGVCAQPLLCICGAWLGMMCDAKGAAQSPSLSFLGGPFPRDCALGADPSVPSSWVAQPQCPQALARPATTNDDVSEMALVPWGPWQAGQDGSGCGRKVCGDTFSLVYQLWGCLPSPEPSVGLCLTARLSFCIFWRDQSISRVCPALITALHPAGVGMGIIRGQEGLGCPWRVGHNFPDSVIGSRALEAALGFFSAATFSRCQVCGRVGVCVLCSEPGTTMPG